MMMSAVKAHLAAKGPEALKKHLDAKKAHAHDNDAPAPHHGGCPGSMAREIQHTAPSWWMSGFYGSFG